MNGKRLKHRLTVNVEDGIASRGTTLNRSRYMTKCIKGCGAKTVVDTDGDGQVVDYEPILQRRVLHRCKE